MTITTNYGSRALLIALIPMIAALSFPASAKEKMGSVRYVYENGTKSQSLPCVYNPMMSASDPACRILHESVQRRQAEQQAEQAIQQQANQRAQLEAQWAANAEARRQAQLQRFQQEAWARRMQRQESRNAMRGALLQGVLGMINRANGGE